MQEKGAPPHTASFEGSEPLKRDHDGAQDSSCGLHVGAYFCLTPIRLRASASTYSSFLCILSLSESTIGTDQLQTNTTEIRGAKEIR